MLACGGYFLTRSVERPEYVSGDLLPPRLLSLSDCICDFVPDLWAIEWANTPAADRATKAGSHGIAEALLPEVIRWTTDRVKAGEFGWPCVFLSIQDAQAFAARFLSGKFALPF